MEIKVKVCRPGVKLPRYATNNSAAVDLCAAVDAVIPAKRVWLVPTGLCMEIPVGYCLQILPRSGYAAEHPGYLANSPGLIDPDYRGEIKLLLRAPQSRPLMVRTGDRVAQGLLVPVEHIMFKRVQELSPTARGANGFGSTGL